MSKYVKPLLIGAAALACVATSLPAQARDDQPHVMTVTLPDGGVARIAYTGDVPPHIVFAPAARVPAMAVPELTIPAMTMPGFAMPSFAALEQVSQAMEREADLMMRALPALTEPRLTGLPAGTQVYSVVSTITNDGACTRRTEITYSGNGAAPREISDVSGACGAPRPRVNAPAPAPHDQPRLLDAGTQNDYRHMVKQAFWQNQ